ncbi:immunoglobulin delta heavy chain [Pelobates cultripes]|nr:immunoglobulin delta heavy chain [Pelobates cultripes]
MKPYIHILLPSCDDKNEVQLVCLVSNFRPAEVFVTWLRNGQSTGKTVSGINPMKNNDGTFSGRSELNVTRGHWDKLDEYTCQVTHQGQLYMKNISKCSACEGNFFPPFVDLLLPLYEDFSNGKGTIKCFVYGNYLDTNAISLKLNENVMTGNKIVEPKDGKEKYLTIAYEVTEAEWNSANKVSCVVKHPCSNTVVEKKEKTINAKDRETKSPTVQILLPSCNNTAAKGVSLNCLVSNFRPGLVSVVWIQNGSPLTDNNKGFDLMKNIDGTFSGRSIHEVPSESWDKNNEYACQVTHKGTIFIEKMSKCTACHGVSMRPVVNLVKSAYADIVDGKGKIICSVVGVDVDTEHITLKIDGKVSVKKSDNARSRGNNVNGTFSITLVEWTKWKSVACVVKNPCSPEIVEKEITIAVPRSVSVRVFHSPDSLEHKTLLCIVDGHIHKEITITWKHKNTNLKCTSSHLEYNDDGTFTSSCTLTVEKKTWATGYIYSCGVTGVEFKDTLPITDISALDNSGIIPTLEIHKPYFKTLFLNKSGDISCKTNVPHAAIEWMEDEKKWDGTMKAITGGWLQSTTQVSLQDWKTKRLACKLKSPGNILLKRTQSINTLYTPAEVKPPKVYLLPPFQESEDLDNNLTLLCVVKGFYPQDLFVTWEINNTMIPQGYNPGTSDISCHHEKKQCSTTSQLLILRTEWNSGTTYACLVAHVSSAAYTRQNRSISTDKRELTAFESAIDIIKPSFKDLFLDKSANVSCSTSHENATIQWILDGERIHPNYNETLFKHNMTWFQSTIDITLEQWKATSKLTCQVKDYKGAVIESRVILPYTLGKMKAPVVHLLSSASDNVDTENKTLTCLVTAFYPGDLFVNWEVVGFSIQLDAPDMSKLTCDHEAQQCSYVSQLSIPKDTWFKGVTYVCHVAHITLENPIKMNISASYDKMSINDITVYHDEVGENLSDTEEASSVWTTASTFIALFLLTLVYSSFVTFVKVK